MARQVFYTYKLNDAFSRIGEKIIKAKEKMVRATEKVTRKTSLFSKKMFSLKKVMMGLRKDLNYLDNSFVNMTATIGAFLSVAKVVEVGSKFQDSLMDLSSITGATDEKLKQLSDGAMVLSKSMGFAQDKVVNAITDIASAKSELLDSPEALLKITDGALLLANAAGIELTEAVQASVGALNQFNQGADQSARFVNVLAAGAKVGASRVGDTVQALKNAGSVAAQFNVSFEETNALIQVLAKNGVFASEAGTALRGTLSKLEKFGKGELSPSKFGVLKSLEKLKELGLSNKEVIKEFGEENLRSILVLRQNLPLIKQWTRDITGTSVASEQAEKRLSTFNAKMRKMSVTIDEKLIKLFLKLEPMLTKQIESFGQYIDSLDEDKINGFARSLEVVVGAFSKIIWLLGKGIEFLDKFGTLLGETAAAVSTMDFGEFSEGSKSFGAKLASFGSAVIPGMGSLSAALNSMANSQSSETVKQNLQSSSQNPQQKSIVDVNLKAPQNTVESIKTKNTNGKSLNVGVNLEEN